MAQKPSEKIDKRNLPGYLIAADLDELLKDGLTFFGETQTEQIHNQADFTIIRGFFQKYGNQPPPAGLTSQEVLTLKRCLENCVVFRPEGKEEE